MLGIKQPGSWARVVLLVLSLLRKSQNSIVRFVTCRKRIGIFGDFRQKRLFGVDSVFNKRIN